jgi:hypothetical protein
MQKMPKIPKNAIKNCNAFATQTLKQGRRKSRRKLAPSTTHHDTMAQVSVL